MKKYNYLSLNIRELTEISAIFNKNHLTWNSIEEMVLIDIGYQILFNQYPDAWKFWQARLTLEKHPLLKDDNIWIICQTPEIMITEFQKLLKRKKDEAIKELIYTKIITSKNASFFFTEFQIKWLCNSLKEASDYLENQFKRIRE